MPSRTQIAKQLQEDDIRCLKAMADGHPVQSKAKEIIDQYELSRGGFLGLWFLDICTALFFVLRVQNNDSIVDIGLATITLGLFLAYELWLKWDRKRALRIYPSIDGLLAAKTQLNLDAPYIVVPLLFSLVLFAFLLCLYNMYN